MNVQENNRLKAVMKMLDLADEQGESAEFNEQLQLAANLSGFRDSLNHFDTGIRPDRIQGYKVAPKVPYPNDGSNLNLPATPPKTSLNVGQKVVCNQGDKETGTEKILFAEFLELKNKIVTVKDRRGKKRYLFNSDRYEWVIRPIPALPDLPDSFDA
ncbi:hypothetical protein [Spirosoma fluviale]|uniref:Uncharacterized protein n=1 Tax=Spirosoma fluviale TaxID=1597977 RepID=A0A286FCR0_9BACT|nr:hypothetical protein [Spirosoma fluviale]SOD80983.1 hypothetical protein SAMN06269250_1635 [Spirosoma fluviale]